MQCVRRYAGMRIFFAALVLPLFAFGQADWRFAHPEATLVGGIRPSAILNSPLLASVLADGTKQDPSMAMVVGMAKGMLGRVTELRFSLVDNGGKEPDVVALITGNFDESMAAMLAQANTKYIRLDESTFLFGNGPSLEAAAARMKQATPQLQPGALAGTQTLSSHDLWFAGKMPEIAAIKNVSLELRGVSLGMSVRDKVELELAMQTTSPAAAKSLLDNVHVLEAAQPALLKGLLQGFADGNTAHFRMTVSNEVVLEAMRTRVTPTLAASNTPQPLQPAPKPRRATVVIEGLEGGPREIPLQ